MNIQNSNSINDPDNFFRQKIKIVPKVENEKPSPPKRPKSSLFQYRETVYRDICQQNPTFNQVQIAKLIAENFQKLDPKQKLIFELQANVAMSKYQLEKQYLLNIQIKLTKNTTKKIRLFECIYPKQPKIQSRKKEIKHNVKQQLRTQNHLL